MKSRKILSTIITFIIIASSLAIFSQSKAATVNYKLGIVRLRESGYGYKITPTGSTPKTIWKIVSYDSSNTVHYNNALYCIKAGQGFGDSWTSENASGTVNYTVGYNLKDDKATIKSKFGGLSMFSDDATYSKVLWILDNLYVPGQSSEADKQQLLSKVPAETTYGDSSNVWTEMKKTTSELDDLTDDDIEVVQQLAIWYFTNNTDSNYNSSILPALLQNNVKNTDADYKAYGDKYDETTGENPMQYGSWRQEYATNLYNYLITEANNHSTYTGSTNTTVSPLNLNKSETVTITKNDAGTNYIVGPFKIDRVNDGSYTDFVAEFKDQNGNAITNYTLLDANKAATNSTIEGLIGNKFYISIPKTASSNITEVKFSISLSYATTVMTFLTTGEATYLNDQPVVLVEKTTGDYSDSITSKNFDLALRKFITKVDATSLTGDLSREPQISTAELQALANGDDTTAKKEHTKSPILVKPGSLVTYTIRVYNEGDIDGYAKEITDYLPEGLQFESSIVNGVNYNWKLYDKDGNVTTDKTKAVKIKTDYLKTELLNAFDKDNLNLDYADVKVICKVIAETKQTDQSLKNIAAITDCTDKDGNSIDDRDSEPDEFTKNDIDSYEYINDSKAHNQDDDDWEPLLLPGKNIDLALRKFITEVNGTKQTVSREPQVDTSTIAINGTATYNHTKLPVAVQIGDIVTYTIRVYNEGDLDGYVSEITDFLPEYLEFINSTNATTAEERAAAEFNTKFLWELVSNSNGRRIKTTVTSKEHSDTYSTLTGIERENTLLTAFDGGNKLSYVDVQVKCKVKDNAVEDKKITNIAEITGMTDWEGTNVKTDRDSTADSLTDNIPSNGVLPTDSELPTYKDDEINKAYVPGQEDDDDFEKLIIKVIDLSLRKFITEVNGEKQTPSREPQVDTSTIATTGTATYNHTKLPVAVKIGDIVTYTIRVYNEGELDGYVSEITDFLPEYLEFINSTNATTAEERAADEFNKKFGWNFVDNSNERRIKTTITSKDNTNSYSSKTGIDRNNTLLTAFDGGRTLSYIDVQVKCKVKDNAVEDKRITNIAEITGMTNSNGIEVKTDRDSTSNNVRIPSDSELPTYKDDEINKPYVPGQEDDDDFEKLEVQIFDLALKKFITGVNTKAVTDREPTVTKNADKTLSYSPTPDPVGVKTGDLVTYTIRIYNEGNVDGYAKEVTDDLPEGLEYVPSNALNNEYRWVMRDADGNEVTEVSKAKIITTDYLSKAVGERAGRDNLIKAYEKDAKISTTKPFNPDYKEVQVVFKVIEPNTSTRILVNVAQISDDEDKKGRDVTDIDSVPRRNEEYDFDHPERNEDDIDYEHVKLLPFDLALRKFITGVNETPYNNRYPEPTYENGKIKYNHTKDPVRVENGNVVTYTIRVYNEGKIAGYAKEVMDDIPEGLEFLPENAINTDYRWVMYKQVADTETKYDYQYANKKYVKTENAKEADIIVTDYLSKEIGEKAGRNNLIKPFDETLGITSTNPDFRDLKVAFKVTEPNTSDRIIINTAEISDDSDEEGKDIDDIDSVPGNHKEPEDDIDKEYIYVKYFDLSLLKWVSQAIVTVNGETKTTETGHTGEENPEPVVKVEIKEKNINKVKVKFRYTIKVTNEGEIEGYAKEVTDYIPQGLKFVQEDNPEWYVREDGVVATDQLKDTLLKPGESAQVTILLTWINGADNMGLKINVAEISKDWNESNTPDIDSTPDNKKPGEDDIDDAPVILTPQTGAVKVYFALTGGILLVMIIGIALIKKYVL